MFSNVLFNPKAAKKRYSENNSGKQVNTLRTEEVLVDRWLDRTLPSSAGGSERWRWTSLAGCWRWWRGTPSRWRTRWGRTNRMTMWAPKDKAGRTLPKPTTCKRERKKRNMKKGEKNKRTNHCGFHLCLVWRFSPPAQLAAKKEGRNTAILRLCVSYVPLVVVSCSG